MNDRDLKILHHILRFHVSLPSVIQSLFFPDGQAAYAPVMDRLRKSGFIITYRALRGGRSYHQLTRKAVSTMGFPASYAESLGRQALLRQLAILWFCHMNGRPRSFVPDNNSLAPIFQPDDEKADLPAGPAMGESPSEPFIPTGFHCLDTADGFPIYHVYAVTPDTKRDNLFKTIRAHFRAARKILAVAARMDSGQYGFAILVQSEKKKEVIERFVHGKLGPASRDGSGLPLTARAPFVVECVPDFEKAPPRVAKGDSYAAMG